MKQDALLEYSSSIERLRKNEESFALATVVKVHGSASAKVGSKAIFDHTGKNIFGWVGGGCAERFVGEQAVESLREKKGRIVLADLDDEIFGLGVACGGKMEVFIDPITPLEKVSVPRSPLLGTLVEELASSYGLSLIWKENEKPVTSVGDFFTALAESLARQRGKTGLSLRDVKELPVQFGKMRLSQCLPQVSILGQGRIVESLNHHFTLLGWKVRCLPSGEQHNLRYQKGESVVIASHSSRDPQLVKEAYEQGAAYVGMVGSRKRALEVIDYLALQNPQVDLPLFIPVGLDIDAKNPEEIGLSVVAEILREQEGIR